jgi:hypothetical protein
MVLLVGYNIFLISQTVLENFTLHCLILCSTFYSSKIQQSSQKLFPRNIQIFTKFESSPKIRRL